MKAYFRIVPDLHFTIESALAAGDDVLVSWLAEGVLRGHARGARLSARPVQITGCTVTRLKRKRIVHTWNYWDSSAPRG
jgi:predicted ester cyclase